MSAERESGSTTPPQPPRDESKRESLTDLIDRMDRESFRRVLEQRDLRLVSHEIHRR